jgi:hypothetical protein
MWHDDRTSPKVVMRRSLLPSSAAALSLGPFLWACGSTAAPAGGANDAGSDAGFGNDAGSDDASAGLRDAAAPSDASSQLPSEPCTGDAGDCLSGTMTPASGFLATPAPWAASLYRVFPSGGVEPIASQVVAADSTWAFSGLAAWAHYYVEFTPRFNVSAGVKESALTRIGPLAVPTAAGASVTVFGEPVQLDVYEEGAPGATPLVQTASAGLVEIDAGSATVSIEIGSVTTPMPWTMIPNQTPAYYAQFANPPDAQPTYQITTSQPPAPIPATWNLVADTSALTATITAPPAGGTAPANQPLQVAWALEPNADYELVALFQQVQGAWVNVYTSAQPEAADVSEETIPAANLATPGAYLINVIFAKANCPPSADGCVHARTVAREQITVQ